MSMETDDKNCIIIHGCPDDKSDKSYAKHWIPWTKKALEKKGIKTKAPHMPEPWAPVYEKFKKAFEEIEVNENTTLIGTSCSASFLVRWLGETKIKIDKLILVAPWKIPLADNEVEKVFYDYEVDESIAYRANEIILFTSNNEVEEGKESLKIFQDALEGEVIELKKHGRYTEEDMGTVEFPELIEAVLRTDEDE